MSRHLLSRKLQNMSESATIKMAQKARELKAKGIDVISLSLGEPDFDTPDFIKDAAIQALKDGYTKYTPVPGLPVLKEAIAQKLKRDNGLDHELNEIMVSNGAKQCIANICLSLLDEDDEVIIFTPYWVSYFEIVKFCGGKPVPLYAGIDQDFKVRPEQLEDVINEHTKLIIFSSPSNPTGSLYSKEELEALSQVILNHDNLFVLADEIYEYINFIGKTASIGAVSGMKERTLTVNGMSKGFAMTGWRLGYVAGPSWIIDSCAKVQGQFTSGANAFGQVAAAHALRAPLDETFAMRDEFKKRRDLVKNALDQIDGLNTNNPEGAFYFFPEISSFFGRSNGKRVIHDADEFVDVLLDEANVAVVTGTAFGDPNSFRLSYAASEEQLESATERMQNVLGSYK
ncbi:MAG: pyridoxal phosphate-dependent aminotransferase [Saprospiraceae bacterium]|nr:pyridoxal phosphate-dependent aminotransferase [Saprospiraceae bacterium]